MNTTTASTLADVYNDINAIEINKTDSFETSMDKFYEVMRKHGIKKGVKNEEGHILENTAEWIMCFSSFKLHKILAFDVFLIMNRPPEDLQC